MAIRVLIVDDHVGFRRRLRELLEGEGFSVVGEAADAEAALQRAGMLQPDVVLVDVNLPGRDGFALADDLSARRRGRVILMSSREGQVYAGRIARSGADGFIAKHELSGAAIRTVLGTRM